MAYLARSINTNIHTHARTRAHTHTQGASAVGKIAGFPFPAGIPFISELQDTDVFSKWADCYDDGLTLDGDNAVGPRELSDQIAAVHEVVEAAEGAVTSGNPDVDEVGTTEAGAATSRSRASYSILRGILSEKHPDWRRACGLRRAVSHTGETLWFCAACAARASELGVVTVDVD